jgi:hypothetical protein
MAGSIAPVAELACSAQVAARKLLAKRLPRKGVCELVWLDILNISDVWNRRN